MKADERKRYESRNTTQHAPPYGDALAMVHRAGEDEAKPIQIGAVWMSERGNLTFHLDLFPLAWLDPHARRTIVIKKREQSER